LYLNEDENLCTTPYFIRVGLVDVITRFGSSG